ncbi:hypothetical protein M758_4G224400 [Ceratodon purpureus]|uniref:Secreted protein n=1 Tax=Ceratodon purpureus TaxID=3225 RepID=A0A8T0IEW8_CERPU|nr:hypothetical protein KC19_4G219900 [Ceratodon purpureus]KAG0620546.1 hypothetical protein M758_4G224400 [Ceratodon purpureus]
MRGSACKPRQISFHFVFVANLVLVLSNGHRTLFCGHCSIGSSGVRPHRQTKRLINQPTRMSRTFESRGGFG